MSRRRRRVTGLVGWLGGWCLRHPTPFLALGIMASCMTGLWLYAQRADAFRVARVELPQNAALEFPEAILGRSIWSVDLADVARQLKEQQPSMKRVRLIRILPDTLRVELTPRTPVAQLRLDRWYPVDEEGFLLPEGSKTAREDFVQLDGVNNPHAALRVGRVNAGERLQLALRVLKTLRKSPALIGRSLEMIDVSDPRQITLLIDENLEIRCGSETELSEQLARLRAVLNTITRQHLSVQYIDLRFSDPVIAPRV